MATVQPPETAVARAATTGRPRRPAHRIAGDPIDDGDATAGVRRRWRRLRLVGVAVMALWAGGLLAESAFVYHRHFLSQDFATYNQAWTLIGQGHLNPYDTIYGFPFIKADFELIMWPLALLHVIVPQPFVLLAVQDLAIVGTGLVTFLWVTEYLQRRAVRWGYVVAISLLVLAVFIANPGIYGVIQYDVHMEPIATLFLVLGGRDLWSGRLRRAWIWVGLALLCGSFAAIMVIGLGLSAVLAGRETRRTGVLVMASGLAWTGLISVLHANQGSGIMLYAYLAGRTTLSGSGAVTLILWGAITHPWRVTDQLTRRLGDMYVLIKPVGIVGLASAWGFGVPVTVMVTDALNARSEFLRDPFQNCAVFPFVLLGSVMVLVWVAQHLSWGWVASVVVAALALTQAAVYANDRSVATVQWTVTQVAPGTAAQLRSALAQTPPDAEVIATLGIMGRFCSRQWCYFFYPDGARPVKTKHVIFVFATPNENLTTAAGSLSAVAYVRDHLHARVLVDAAGVAAFDWTPPPGVTQVVLPTHWPAG